MAMAHMQNVTDGIYGSVSAFLDAMRLPPRNPVNRELWQYWGFTERRGDWYGADCDTGNDVQKLVAAGWPEGMKRLTQLRDKITTIELTPTDRRRRLRRSDSGDDLDIHAVYGGRLDIAWTTAQRVNMQGPQHIDIAANMICSGGEHADVLFWRGAAAVVLSDILETAGYVTRIVVLFGGDNFAGEKVSCRITVKDYDRLDVCTAASVIMPGFFRALGHGWIANHSKGAVSSSGICVQQGRIEPGELALSHRVRDHGSAVAWINETLRKLNENRLMETAA
jgi:hypothetical protein